MAKKAILVKRVETLEKWIRENEDVGGAGGILETFIYLLNANRKMGQDMQQLQGVFGTHRSLSERFMNENELIEEWNTFVKNVEEEEQNNASQEQSPEKVDVRKEAKDGKKVGEKDSKRGKPSKKSEKKFSFTLRSSSYRNSNISLL